MFNSVISFLGIWSLTIKHFQMLTWWWHSQFTQQVHEGCWSFRSVVEDHSQDRQTDPTRPWVMKLMWLKNTLPKLALVLKLVLFKSKPTSFSTSSCWSSICHQQRALCNAQGPVEPDRHTLVPKENLQFLVSSWEQTFWVPSRYNSCQYAPNGPKLSAQTWTEPIPYWWKCAMAGLCNKRFPLCSEIWNIKMIHFFWPCVCKLLYLLSFSLNVYCVMLWNSVLGVQRCVCCREKCKGRCLPLLFVWPCPIFICLFSIL